MSDRPQYVWRLVVRYPVELNEAALRWLAEQPDEDVWPERGFRWPAVRRYLSEKAAHKRAELLRSYGALVTVEKSAPIEWLER